LRSWLRPKVDDGFLRKTDDDVVAELRRPCCLAQELIPSSKK
jgi:hypothetical protein